VTEWRAVNTSPLIYLSRSGLLDLLKADAQRVVVPQAVADEIFAWPSADAAQVALKTVHWLELAPPSRFQEWYWLGTWGLGSRRFWHTGKPARE